jgi:hypothetical protein
MKKTRGKQRCDLTILFGCAIGTDKELIYFFHADTVVVLCVIVLLRCIQMEYTKFLVRVLGVQRVGGGGLHSCCSKCVLGVSTVLVGLGKTFLSTDIKSRASTLSLQERVVPSRNIKDSKMPCLNNPRKLLDV